MYSTTMHMYVTTMHMYSTTVHMYSTTMRMYSTTVATVTVLLKSKLRICKLYTVKSHSMQYDITHTFGLLLIVFV